MHSMFTTSLPVLHNQDVTFIPSLYRNRLLPGIAMLAILAAPQCGWCAQTRPASSAQKNQRSTPPKTPARRSTAAANSDDQELKLRYQAAQEAAAKGDADAVIAANKRVAAIALRQLGNLRLLQSAAPQAAETLRESLALEDSLETRLALALAALGADQPDESLGQTDKVLLTDRGNARAWFISGKAWMAKGDYKAAANALQSALKLKDDPNTRFALAMAYLDAKEKPAAETIFKQMLADYGERAIWHVVIAGAYRDSGNNDDAAREFRKAIAIDNGIDHAHFFLGLTLLQQNHWSQTEDSMAEFREAVRLDPEDQSSNFYLGAGEAEYKEFDSSNRHLLKAIEKDPSVPEVWQYLGLNAFQQQKNKEAREYLEKAIQTTGKDEARNNFGIKKSYIALSRIEFSEGNKEKAQQYSQKARELQNRSLAVTAESITETMEQSGMGQAPAVMPHSNLPKEQAQAPEIVDPTARVSGGSLNPEQAKEVADLEARLRKLLSSSFNDWGTAEARQGMFAFALEHFQEAEKWDDTTPGLMRNVGLAALRMNNEAEAVRAFQKQVATDPADLQTRARLAMMLYSASKYPEAAAQFAAIGDAVYEDPGMAYAWGFSLTRTRQYKQATVVLDRLMQHPLPPEVLVSVGDLYGTLEFYEPAIAAYRKAIEENPAVPRSHYKLGAALIRLDRSSEAVPELQQALKEEPNDPDVQYNLAYALLQTSQKDQAVALLQNITAAHPDHPQAQYELGKTLLEDGKLQDAVQHLELAAKLDPERDYIHYQLQVAYRRVGRAADADNELKIYREIKARKRDSVVLPKPEP